MTQSEAGVVPLLVDAMVAAHLTGRRRSDLQAAPRFTRRGVRTFATTFEGTIGFMAARMEATATELELLRRQYGDAATKMSRDASAALERELSETAMKAILEGVDTRKGVTALRDAFRRAGFSPEADYRLEAMFRTQTQMAYSAGRVNAWRDPVIDEILWGYEYSTIGDDRVRPTHMAMEGTRAAKDDPVWMTWTPPCGWNSVPWNCPVLTQGGWKPIVDVRIGENVWTHGNRWRPVTELHDHSGPDELISVELDEVSPMAFLRITGNHAVLTKRGWINAASLQEGDEVAYPSVKSFPQVPGWEIDDVCNVERLDDRMMSLGINAGRFPLQFNSASHVGQIEVHPEAVGGLVELEANADGFEDCRELGLAIGHSDSRVQMERRIASVISLASFGSAPANIWSKKGRSRSQRGDRFVDAFGVGSIMKQARIGARSHFDSVMSKDSSHRAKLYAGLLRNRGHVTPARRVISDHLRQSARPREVDSGFGGDAIGVAAIGLYSHGGNVVARWRRVKRVSRISWGNRPVYNLAVAEDNSYCASGVVVHNCRCTLLEIFKDEPKYAVATEIPNVQPDAGFGFNPGDVYRDLIGARKAA